MRNTPVFLDSNIIKGMLCENNEANVQRWEICLLLLFIYLFMYLHISI